MEVKTLVIDANVARAAGGDEATFPVSKHTRDTLMAIQTFGHKVAMDETGMSEWKKHSSYPARLWLLSMIQNRKVLAISRRHTDAIAEAISSNGALHDGEKNLLRKDIHLIDAAFQHDRVVVSLDGRFFACLPKATIVRTYCAFIIWVNPKHLDEAMTEWLRRASLADAESAQSPAIRCVT